MKKNKYTRMEPQIDSLFRELDRELDNFPTGTRFHSLRQLQEKYGSHRGIIDRTLTRMEERQLIRRVPRIGIFSNVTRRTQARKVLFFLPDWPSNMIREWSAAANRYIAERKEWQLQERLIDPELPLSASCLPEDAAAMILFSPSTGISTGDMIWLASLKIPAVLLNADSGSFEISCVSSDDCTGAALVSSFLHSRGHRRVAVIYSEPHSAVSENRIRNLLVSMKLLGMETILIDCATMNCEYSPHKAYMAMKQYLEENDSRADFTAVYSITGYCVPEVMTALRESGYELPRDISIISMTSEENGRFNHPPLTAACNDIAMEVAVTFEGLREVLEKKRNYFKALVPMRLIERASVKNISGTQTRKGTTP